jgi:predicted Rossmann fold nucleotide-binding protein DprA/Smf involved in DNA uptake
VLTEAARQASNAAKSRRHAKHLQALHDALTPEGEGVTALAARLGVAAVSVRKWAAELEADGRAIREAVDAQGTLRIRRAKA